jgi:hypothetical protein
MDIVDARRYILETIQHHPRDEYIWMIPAGVPLFWYGPTDEGKPRKWEVEINRNKFLATHKCTIRWAENSKPVIASITPRQGYRREGSVTVTTESHGAASEASCGDRDPAQESTQSAQTKEGPETTLETIQQTSVRDGSGLEAFDQLLRTGLAKDQ